MINCNVLGIDVSKDTLVIYDQATQETISLSNSTSDLETAVKDKNWNSQNRIIGLESTGDYSFLPMQFFTRLGFAVKLLNPIVTKRFIKSTIRNKKTDKSDAEAIAVMVSYGEGQTVTENELDLAKKSLLRLERKITDTAAKFKRIRKSLATKAGNGIHVEHALEEIDSLISEIEARAKNIWNLTRQESRDRQEEIISSHIGCGEKMSAIISAEAGDIKRFPSPKQFKAYAGIDPKVSQSGQLDVRGKMTKRGNSILRQALFISAFVASNHDPELRQYYLKKRSEGKSHTHAVCAVARKLCERIYATVTQDRLYELRYPQGIT